jgi:hypothetical protein
MVSRSRAANAINGSGSPGRDPAGLGSFPSGGSTSTSTKLSRSPRIRYSLQSTVDRLPSTVFGVRGRNSERWKAVAERVAISRDPANRGYCLSPVGSRFIATSCGYHPGRSWFTISKRKTVDRRPLTVNAAAEGRATRESPATSARWSGTFSGTKAVAQSLPAVCDRLVHAG